MDHLVRALAMSTSKIIDDPRNKLYKYFVQLKKINPKIVVMENVKGMYPYADQVKQDFEKISDDMTYDVLVSINLVLYKKDQDFSLPESGKI